MQVTSRTAGAEMTLLETAGVTLKQVSQGEVTRSPLFEALRMAERFGQDPFAFLERMRGTGKAELETLRWYEAIRSVQEAAME